MASRSHPSSGVSSGADVVIVFFDQCCRADGGVSWIGGRG